MKEILQNEQMIRQKLTEALQKENEAFWLNRLEEGNAEFPTDNMAPSPEIQNRTEPRW